MLTNTNSRSSTADVDLDLRSEVARLESEVAALTTQLRRILSLSDEIDVTDLELAPAEESRPKENPYVFAREDSEAAAFDDFFNMYDPHLEKTRSFLLD